MAIHLPGRLYHLFIDPLLSGLRQDLSGWIPGGSSVLEAACGTGEQAIALASSGNRVLGIDLDSAMIAYAGSRIPGALMESLSFQTADAGALSFIADREYEYACICLALHAMSPSDRVPVLQELGRIAGKVLIADYSCPMKKSFGGRIAGIIEYIAGGEHLAGYQNFQKTGGLESLVKEAGFNILKSEPSMKGLLQIVLLG